MPNECSNYITITSRAETAETDIQAILQEIQSKSRQFVIITQRSKAGLRCKYITAWVPNIEFIETLLEGIVSNAKREANEHAWKRVGPLYVSRVYLTRKDEFPDVHIYPMKYFYPMHWRGIKDPALHEKVKIPAESMLFQYGYSTNSFQDHFNALRKTRRKH
jgi:hypothetical protein